MVAQLPHRAQHRLQVLRRGVRPRSAVATSRRGILPGQRCLQHRLSMEPAPSDCLARTSTSTATCNTYFHVTDSHTELRVVGLSDVEVDGAEFDPAVCAQPWERAGRRERMTRGPWSSPWRHRWCRCRRRSRQYADVSFTPGRPISEAVNDLTHRIHTEFKYGHGATSVNSTVSRRAGGEERGVPGLRPPGGRLPAVTRAGRPVRLRLSGDQTAARQAADDRRRRQPRLGGGAAGSDSTWLNFDPTNDTFADERYTTVAWGRDYDDVAAAARRDLHRRRENGRWTSPLTSRRCSLARLKVGADRMALRSAGSRRSAEVLRARELPQSRSGLVVPIVRLVVPRGNDSCRADVPPP